jgi:dTDP-glucose 4,6-dehydratase
MRSVLVTGGAGFIGSNFVRFLLNADPDVLIVNLDALTYAGSPENLRNLPDPNRHSFVKGDICDRPLVTDLLRRHRIDTVVHFAAETHVDRSILGPDQFIQTNVHGTFSLLESVRRFWLEEQSFSMEDVCFHHISTDEVFGSLGPEEPPFSELTPYAPNSPYAASKAASDHLARAYQHTYGLPVTITNCSNNYGPYQFPEKLIPLMIMNSVGGQPYNIGGENQPTNLAIVQTLCEILDELLPESKHAPHASLIKHVTDRPGHDRRYAMDTTKIKRELGWQPRQSLESGLMKTVSWYLEHPEWVAAIRQQIDYQNWLARNYEKRGG